MSNGLKLVLFLAEILTLGSAVLVALHPNVLYASVALLFAFLGVAVMFVYAGADFIAGAQVIVYVGGVTILILFAIMLTQWLYKLNLREIPGKILLPILVVGVAVVPALYKVIRELTAFIEKAPPTDLEKFSSLPKTSVIGQALLTNYVLPFEAITILLLGALVGAVWLARPTK